MVHGPQVADHKSVFLTDSLTNCCEVENVNNSMETLPELFLPETSEVSGWSVYPAHQQTVDVLLSLKIRCKTSDL